MTPPQRPVFRAEAIQFHREGKATTVLPRLASPSGLMLLWVLLGVFLVAGLGGVWVVHVPIHASGSVAAKPGREDKAVARPTTELVVFLPPKQLPNLRLGQEMQVRLGSASERLNVAIVAVEPRIVGTHDAEKRFGISPSDQTVSWPAAVAIVRMESPRGGSETSFETGSVYGADIEVASRRLISLLPLVGSRFEGS